MYKDQIKLNFNKTSLNKNIEILKKAAFLYTPLSLSKKVYFDFFWYAPVSLAGVPVCFVDATVCLSEASVILAEAPVSPAEAPVSPADAPVSLAEVLLV